MAAATPCVLPSLAFNSTALTHEATHFLPPRLGVRAHVPADDPVARAVEQLDEAIRRSQAPLSAAECKTRGVRLSIVEGGFGKTLNSFVKPMLHCLLHDKVPLGAQRSNQRGPRPEHFEYHRVPAWPLDLFKNRSKCESESFECFLQPFSNCSADFRLKRPAKMLGSRFPASATYNAIFSGAPPAAESIIRSVELAGRFNTVVLLLSSLIRPSAAVSARLEQVKRSLGWPDSSLRRKSHQPKPLLIGLHLRAGDSCTKEAKHQHHNRTCEPLSAYLPAVHDMERAYGAGRQVYVYFSTDDQKAAAEARRLTAVERNPDDPNWGTPKSGSVSTKGHRRATLASRPTATDGSAQKASKQPGGVGRAIWLIRSDAEVRRQWRFQKSRQVLQIEALLEKRLIDGHDDALELMVDLLLMVECDALVVSVARHGVAGC